MRHGEIRWYVFRPPDKKRPVLILTRTSALGFLNEVTVAPLTSTVRNIPTEVIVGPDDGVPAVSAINLDHVQTVPKAKIGKLIAALPERRRYEVRRALLFAVGFE
jgi:mRNA interferase MazF